MGTQAVELAVTPTTLLACCVAEPFPVLLDGQGVESWSNGDAILVFGPHSTLRITAFDHGEVCERGTRSTWTGDPFTLLERFCTAHVPQRAPGDGRMVVTALNYDLRRCIERFTQPVASDAPLPLLVAAAYEWCLRYSYVTQRFSLQAPPAATVDLASIARRLRRAVASGNAERRVAPLCVTLDSTRARHAAGVRRILDYIAAGDVYQVNLAHRFAGLGASDPYALFAALQRANPVPFGAYVDCGNFTLLSNSPECLLTLAGDRLMTAPIKGTRRRGNTAEEDIALQQALLSDPKERAEHVMIVDLERNDLGRVCKTATVQVESMAALQTFAGLHHMVSIVRGERRADAGLATLLRALFPGGSVTGAPKIRAMQIIDELEPYSRGFYTGAIGCVRALDEAVFSLTIRTATVCGERLWYWAGGGIVADSVPEREYDETILKALPFLKATGAR